MSAAEAFHDCDRHDRDGDYAMVADAVIDAFNPPDDDRAEESILRDAVYTVRDFIDGLPCYCTPQMEANHDPCGRCRVLGRLGDKAVSR